ncbi:hypothetical protein GCM10010156_52770 [Planobispora rosea]|uniref:Uncharacterized protein n=1 Tax=Planobispora rosea TaxID=35762 RepID=A0A8J3S813_PLARO|nr:hypothetical protein [Planobispora rosea]GGS87694.1 hypothetical protein GCM10010156_52770 [Planobispora rosea]GIH86679.1 hypothetical protein Pro02_50870 [Planobispora rosea]
MADPVSPAAGQFIDKPFWDAEVHDRWVHLYAPWELYTPEWTSTGAAPTLGNGSLTGRYKKIGKTVFFHIRLVYGSTTTSPAGVVWYLSLPFPPAVDSVASARGNPGGGNHIPLTASLLTNGKAWFTKWDGGATGPTSPGTWANGNNLTVSGVYETAA